MTLREFEAIAETHPYQPKGVFYSEMFLFLRMCERAAVTMVIESGVKYGMSTTLLSAAFPGSVISIDRSFQIMPPARVTFVCGDARDELPRLVAAANGDQIGVLIDGPKGVEAMALRDRCWESPSVTLVALHGVLRGQGETRHSHDPGCRSYQALDRFVLPAFREAYPNGPGLGVWTRRS